MIGPGVGNASMSGSGTGNFGLILVIDLGDVPKVLKRDNL